MMTRCSTAAIDGSLPFAPLACHLKGAGQMNRPGCLAQDTPIALPACPTRLCPGAYIPSKLTVERVIKECTEAGNARPLPPP